MTKHIVLCADDYGQSLAISQAIIDLIMRNRLTATSCIVNVESSSKALADIAAYRNQIDIGLHFNLTMGQPLSTLYRQKMGNHFLSLSKLMMALFCRRITAAVVKAELLAQIEAFSRYSGAHPIYIDGHQHVHQFPLIQDVIIDVLQTEMPKQTYVRLVQPNYVAKNIKLSIKQSIIRLFGATAFARKIKQFAIVHNTDFSGIYDFGGDYRQWFKYFIKQIPQQGIIMCHPGLQQSDVTDEISAARFAEYQYFISPEFASDCAQEDIKLVRFFNNFMP